MPTAQASIGQLHTDYASYVTPTGVPGNFDDLLMWKLMELENNGYTVARMHVSTSDTVTIGYGFDIETFGTWAQVREVLVYGLGGAPNLTATQTQGLELLRQYREGTTIWDEDDIVNMANPNYGPSQDWTPDQAAAIASIVFTQPQAESVLRAMVFGNEAAGITVAESYLGNVREIIGREYHIEPEFPDSTELASIVIMNFRGDFRGFNSVFNDAQYATDGARRAEFWWRIVAKIPNEQAVGVRTRLTLNASMFGVLPADASVQNPEAALEAMSHLFRAQTRLQNGLGGADQLVTATFRNALDVGIAMIRPTYAPIGDGFDVVQLARSTGETLNVLPDATALNLHRNLMVGSAASDTLNGGQQADYLWGMAGNDFLSGGGGSDIYVFRSGDGIDTIRGDHEGVILVNGIQLDGDQAHGWLSSPGWLNVPTNGNRPVWLWQTGNYLWVYTLRDGDLNDGTLWIEGGNLAPGDRIVIEHFSAINGDLGIDVPTTPRTALVANTSSRSPFADPDYVAATQSTTLSEGLGRGFSFATDLSVMQGCSVRFTVNGLGNSLQVCTGADTLSFNSDGTLDIVLEAGQTTFNYALLSQGDVDTDQNISLTATLLDANGMPMGTASSMNIAFDAVEEVGSDNADTRYAVGVGASSPWAVLGVGRLYNASAPEWYEGVHEYGPTSVHYFRTDTTAVSSSSAEAYLSEYVDRSLAAPSAGGNYVGTSSGLGNSHVIGSAYRDVIIDGANVGDWPTVVASGSIGDNDVLRGGVGDDVLQTHGGNDQSYGGDGNDLILDTPMASSMLWGEYAYYVDRTWLDTPGHSNNDGLFGEGGNDVIVAGAGNALIDGGTGNDQLYGGGNDDVVLGGEGNDILWGDGLRSNSLYGYSTSSASGMTNDTVTSVTDILAGGRLADLGGVVENIVDPGKDFLDGGAGNDEQLFAGSGDELFLLRAA